MRQIVWLRRGAVHFVTLVNFRNQIPKFPLEVVLVDRKASEARQEPDKDHDYEHRLHIIAVSIYLLRFSIIVWNTAAVRSGCVVAINWDQDKQGSSGEGRNDNSANNASDLEPDTSLA